MRLLRTFAWVVLAALVAAFLTMNLDKVHVRFWPLGNADYLMVEWPVGVIAVFFFLLGWLPTWLVHLAGKWRLKRRISALEAVTRQPSAALTSTQLANAQLDAAGQSGETPGVQ